MGWLLGGFGVGLGPLRYCSLDLKRGLGVEVCRRGQGGVGGWGRELEPCFVGRWDRWAWVRCGTDWGLYWLWGGWDVEVEQMDAAELESRCRRAYCDVVVEQQAVAGLILHFPGVYWGVEVGQKADAELVLHFRRASRAMGWWERRDGRWMAAGSVLHCPGGCWTMG